MTHFPLTKAGGNTIWQSVPVCKSVYFMALFAFPPGPQRELCSGRNLVGAQFTHLALWLPVTMFSVGSEFSSVLVDESVFFSDAE